jgi:hypothetical protein
MDETRITQKITAAAVRGWLYEILAIIGIAGPFFLLYAGFVSLFADVNYNPISDSISSLALTGMGWFQDIGFLVTGFFMEVFAAILFLSMKGARGFGLGNILLALSGFLLLFVGLFPTDNPNFPHTFEGTIHGIAANTLFIVLPLAILLIAPTLRKSPYWRSLFGYSIATAGFAIVWIAMYRIFLPGLSWFGLFERILAMVELAWVEVMAIGLLPLARRPAPKESTATDVPAPSEQRID